MSEIQAEKVSYPYMGVPQWFGIRAKLRQSVPSVVSVDWLMAALGTSEKGAKNILPQLRAIGIIDPENKPTQLAHDLRDDNHYSAACAQILEKLYPETLRHSYDDPAADSAQVASWFMRNARTGQAAAKMQAKLYLTLLKAELPSDDEQSAMPRKRVAKGAQAKKITEPAASSATALDDAQLPVMSDLGVTAPTPTHLSPQIPQPQALGPALHIDLQIHISADASDTQIDAVFKSMAKHLYGRD